MTSAVAGVMATSAFGYECDVALVVGPRRSRGVTGILPQRIGRRVVVASGPMGQWRRQANPPSTPRGQ